MAMYHSWDSQNAWLRQIHAHNYLMVNPRTAQAAGIADGGWLWVESPWGKVRGMCRYTEAVEPGTVWTWNAIGKASGAWHLAPDANESRKGFLLNHLITEELPARRRGAARSPTPTRHRPGGVVRRARAHLPGRAPTSRRRARRSSRRRRCRAGGGAGVDRVLRRRRAAMSMTAAGRSRQSSAATATTIARLSARR